jgi:hypothetical protein
LAIFLKAENRGKVGITPFLSPLCLLGAKMGEKEEEKLTEALKVLLKTCHKWIIVMSLSPEERAGIREQTTFSMACLEGVSKREFLSICENLSGVCSEMIKEYQKRFLGLIESDLSSHTIKEDSDKPGPDK